MKFKSKYWKKKADLKELENLKDEVREGQFSVEDVLKYSSCWGKGRFGIMEALKKLGYPLKTCIAILATEILLCLDEMDGGKKAWDKGTYGKK